MIRFSIGTVGAPRSGERQCLGITCAGACNVAGCGQTCTCTQSCNLYCPNGDCLACCSCYSEAGTGVGDVVAVYLDSFVYVANHTQVPHDRSNKDFLHSELSKVNQTWWQVDDDGSFYELPKDLVAGVDCGASCSAGFSCQLECELYEGTLGCYSGCTCSQSSSRCSLHCSSPECATLCSCNRIG